MVQVPIRWAMIRESSKSESKTVGKDAARVPRREPGESYNQIKRLTLPPGAVALRIEPPTSPSSEVV